MIYTLTLNPSIDYVVNCPNLNLGEVNRLQSDLKLPGGKGINVSRILQRLNIPNTALGYLGGFTGSFIEEELHNEKITTDFLYVDDETRINIKLKTDTEETEINGVGPTISIEKQIELKQIFATTLKPNDIVVLAGSMPKGLSEDFYDTLITIIHDCQADFVIDTTGKKLLATLPNNPLLVKPNHHELAEMFDVTFKTIDDILPYGQKLLELGAKNAIISMAGDGALFFSNEHIYFAKPIKGTVQNSVGAGDSMIAGFVGSYHQTNNLITAFKYGVACGTATAFSKDLATLDTIEHYLNHVEITTLQ